MRIARIITVLTIVSSVFVIGCENNKNDLRLQNRSLQQRIGDLESRHNAAQLQLQQCEAKLKNAQDLCNADTDALRDTIAAMKEDIAAKEDLIENMSTQLQQTGVFLPPELSSKLEEFANTSDMITYVPQSGMVKFKSDLLFEKGSDQVQASAQAALDELADIVKSQEASGFDVVIAGHTDDIPIKKPSTLQKHPSNWHLSAHRAISVLGVLQSNGVDSNRMSVRGFGDNRPVAPNAPGQKGNPKNRRVEIYIVPKGK